MGALFIFYFQIIVVWERKIREKSNLRNFEIFLNTLQKKKSEFTWSENRAMSVFLSAIYAYLSNIIVIRRLFKKIWKAKRQIHEIHTTGNHKGCDGRVARGNVAEEGWKSLWDKAHNALSFEDQILPTKR